MMTLRPLAYDDTPRRRRLSAKWLVIAGLLTAALAGWRWWPVVWHGGTLWLSSAAVIRVTLPSDTVAIDDGGVVRIPPPSRWVTFHRLYDGGLSSEEATLFLAERNAPNGAKRLVEVGCWGNAPAYEMNPRNAMTWQTFEFTRSNTIVDSRAGFNVANGILKPNGIAFFTGVADPSDLSHFSIRCRIDHQDRFVDGYLMNDGTVRLELRGALFSGRAAGATAPALSSTPHPPAAISPRAGS